MHLGQSLHNILHFLNVPDVFFLPQHFCHCHLATLLAVGCNFDPGNVTLCQIWPKPEVSTCIMQEEEGNHLFCPSKETILLP